MTETSYIFFIVSCGLNVCVFMSVQRSKFKEVMNIFLFVGCILLRRM
jgi:hypothetical protein